MKKLRADGLETRRKLLSAASELFAQKGFRDTTNVDICEKAGVNAASVNYHFSSKENLYVEAWKYSFEKSIKKHPPEGKVPPSAPVEQRLRGQIFALMERITDPEAYDFDIIHKEMANPTGLLNETIDSAIAPLGEKFKQILRDLLGINVSDKHLGLCHLSITGQCFGPLLHIRQTQKSESIPKPKNMPDFNIEELAEHIYKFSLAGVKTYLV